MLKFKCSNFSVSFRYCHPGAGQSHGRDALYPDAGDHFAESVADQENEYDLNLENHFVRGNLLRGMQCIADDVEMNGQTTAERS